MVGVKRYDHGAYLDQSVLGFCYYLSNQPFLLWIMSALAKWESQQHKPHLDEQNGQLKKQHLC